jgi:glycine cleavage system H protein
MNQFFYTDIFDTKGIEYLVVIGFLLLIIPFWIMLNRPLKLKARVGQALGALTARVLRIPQGLFYHRNHTWTHLERSGLAMIGLDDLLLHLTGGVELEYLKDQQERVKKGEPIARIIQEGKNLVIASPISGRIERLHRSLEKNPGAIIEDPYTSWLARIKPENWREETGGTLMAEEATRWAEEELERFKEFMASELTGSPEQHEVIMQAGGELVDYPLSGMDQRVWTDFQNKFLLP